MTHKKGLLSFVIVPVLYCLLLWTWISVQFVKCCSAFVFRWFGPLHSKMLHKVKTQTFRLCRKKNFIKQEISVNTRGSARVSLHHCALVKAAHTSGLTHHTLVSCEAFTNAQLHTSASIRRGNDRRCRASITRIVCSNTNIQYKIQKINKTTIVG